MVRRRVPSRDGSVPGMVASPGWVSNGRAPLRGSALATVVALFADPGSSVMLPPPDAATAAPSRARKRRLVQLWGDRIVPPRPWGGTHGEVFPRGRVKRLHPAPARTNLRRHVQGWRFLPAHARYDQDAASLRPARPAGAVVRGSGVALSPLQRPPGGTPPPHPGAPRRRLLPRTDRHDPAPGHGPWEAAAPARATTWRAGREDGGGRAAACRDRRQPARADRAPASHSKSGRAGGAADARGCTPRPGRRPR